MGRLVFEEGLLNEGGRLFFAVTIWRQIFQEHNFHFFRGLVGTANQYFIEFLAVGRRGVSTRTMLLLPTTRLSSIG